jgi:hypothetical protein
MATYICPKPQAWAFIPMKPPWANLSLNIPHKKAPNWALFRSVQNGQSPIKINNFS